VAKRWIGGHQRNVFDFGLCGEHAVERVAVAALHHSGMARVLKAKRQRLETEGGDDDRSPTPALPAIFPGGICWRFPMP